MGREVNLLDRFIGWVSPRVGCRRLEWRAELGEMVRNYDAGRMDRFGNWYPPRSATPEETDSPYRSLIRGRARDLERNNDVVQGIIGTLERNVVGTGIKPQPLLKSSALNDRINELWREWTQKENCDITAGSTFYQLQKMFVRRKLVDGEIMALVTQGGAGTVPLQLQMIEPDLLAEEVIKYDSGINLVYGGVEVDAYMRPVAYHFRLDPLRWEITRIEASRVIHSFRKLRPTQLRGMSGLSGTMDRLRDLGEYIGSELRAARRAAMTTGVIRTAQGSVGPGMKNMKKDGAGDRYEEVKEGHILRLSNNDGGIDFSPPGRPNTAAAPFTSFIMRLIGISCSLSNEAVSRDLSQVNYSSARQGHLEDRRTFEEWQVDIVENFCKPVYAAFLDACVLEGLLKIPDYWQSRKDYQACRWVAPGWSWIDPLKEAVASEKLLSLGLTTLEEQCGSRGEDWKAMLDQKKREQDYIEMLGLRLAPDKPETVASVLDDAAGEEGNAKHGKEGEDAEADDDDDES